MREIIIAAVADNGVIANDGDIPWDYPEDLAHFRETTTGHPVIMGRTTYEEIVDDLGGPLPDRDNIVLTHDTEYEAMDDVDLAYDIDQAVETAATYDDETYIIGGASIYDQFLDRADEMILTAIPDTPDGDTYFPEWDRDDWTHVGTEQRGDIHIHRYEADRV